MITTGAITISKMMIVNHSLQRLYIGKNKIGDNGISAIAGALGKCKINELGVKGCGITLTGTRSLAAALSSNYTIRQLYLRHNPITVKGATLILTTAVHNTGCQLQGLVFDDEYKNDEVKKMLNILEERRRQEVRHRIV